MAGKTKIIMYVWKCFINSIELVPKSHFLGLTGTITKLLRVYIKGESQLEKTQTSVLFLQLWSAHAKFDLKRNELNKTPS